MSTVSVSDQPFVVEVDETTEAVSVASPGPQGATGPTGPQGPTGATGPQGPSGVIAVTSPITNSGTSTSADIGIQDGTTAQKGAVQLEDSTASTSTTKAATPNSVKSAYDLANTANTAAGTKVSSVTGTSPIASSGGTTPAISIQDGTTAQKGAVQLEDSTSSTSTTKAATPNSVKSAYDLANGKPSLSSSNPVALGTAAPGAGTAASKDDHVHPTTGLLLSASASAARPLLTDGAYLSGSALIMAGLTSNYASSPDSAALSITGDLEIVCRVKMNDWTPANPGQVFVSKSAASGTYSFIFDKQPSSVRFAWSADGTNYLSASSTVDVTAADGDWLWIKVEFDVDNGAAGRSTKFYTAADQSTEPSSWTQLGTTVTQAGTTSIFDSTAALNVGAHTNGANSVMNGQFKQAIIRNGIGGTVAFNANFETATADALAFAESSSNAATVTINTTRYTYGIPNRMITSIATAANTANVDFHVPFFVSKSTVVDMVYFEVTTGPASNSTVYFGIYAADNNFQPTGTPTLNDSLAVGSGTTGIFSKQFTPVTLTPGTYTLAMNSSVAMTFRATASGATNNISGLGANGILLYPNVTRTAAAFPSSPTTWNVLSGSTVGQRNFINLRWKAA